MSVNFKSNPFLDTVIFAGIDFKYANQLNGIPLKGEAAQKALENLKKSYEEHKANLNLKYGQFLKNVEGNISEFNKPEIPSKVRHAVATKLSDLANRRITIKESNFSGIHKFFHKIGQLFKGHGFRTKGEWGVELASRMEKVDSEIYKSQLEKCIFHGIGLGMHEKPPQQILDEMKEKINSLTETQFKQVLNDIIFKKKEKNFFGEKNKLIFYKNLNEEKRKIFDNDLLSRSDWYEQAFDIIEGSDDEEFKGFVSKEMVSLFQSNPKKIIQIYENQKNKNGWFERFFNTVVEATIKDYLEKDSFIEIANLLYRNSSIKSKKIFESPQILTPQEIEKLKSNVQIYMY